MHPLDRRFAPETLLLLPRMEQCTLRLVRLGPRPVVELLTELGCEFDALPHVANRLARYASLPPELVRAIGADRITPRRPLLVPTNRTAP